MCICVCWQGKYYRFVKEFSNIDMENDISTN